MSPSEQKLDYDTLWVVRYVWFLYGLRCKNRRVLEVMRPTLWLAGPWSPFSSAVPLGAQLQAEAACSLQKALPGLHRTMGKGGKGLPSLRKGHPSLTLTHCKERTFHGPVSVPRMLSYGNLTIQKIEDAKQGMEMWALCKRQSPARPASRICVLNPRLPPLRSALTSPEGPDVAGKPRGL